MALGEDTKKMLAIKLPHVPVDVLERLDSYIGAAKALNGGYAVFTIPIKAGKIAEMDVQMRDFLRNPAQNQKAS